MSKPFLILKYANTSIDNEKGKEMAKQLNEELGYHVIAFPHDSEYHSLTLYAGKKIKIKGKQLKKLLGNGKD